MLAIGLRLIVCYKLKWYLAIPSVVLVNLLVYVWIEPVYYLLGITNWDEFILGMQQLLFGTRSPILLFYQCFEF